MDTRARDIVDRLQRQLDEIEKTTPMTVNYARIEPEIVHRTDGGREFDFIIYHHESELWYRNGSEASLDVIEVRPDDRIFDIGCNSGLYTTWFGLFAPQGKVVAFDPFPWNAAATRANAELNGLTNVTVHEVGLGAKDTTIRVHINTASIYHRANGGISLKIERPDRYLAETRPTFIKMDIEGAERELARTDLLTDSVERAYVEMHPQLMDNEPTVFLDYAAKRNFSIRKGLPTAPRLKPPFHVEPTGYFLERQDEAVGDQDEPSVGWFARLMGKKTAA
jgi:FkbM family methyltransferase